MQVKWAGEVKLLDQELNTVWFCLPVRPQEKEDYYISSLATLLTAYRMSRYLFFPQTMSQVAQEGSQSTA